MEKSNKIVVYLLLIFFAIIIIFPIFWVLSTSIKPGSEAMKFPPSLFPDKMTLENYFYVFTNSYLVRSLINSIIVVIPSVILSVTISALAAYGFARYSFKGKDLLFGLMLGLFMIPVLMNLIPLYISLQKLNLLNSYIGLILTYQVLIVPLNIFMLKNYFETIPVELEEAAMIDGCSRLQAMTKVVLPLVWPGLATSMILSFRFAWNQFLFPLTFTSQPDKQVFQVAIYNFMGLYQINWGYLTASIIVGMIPILIILIIFQRRFISGLTAGAVKG
jgi:ABC-type glycerol-3-phosphate transport system permease component